MPPSTDDIREHAQNQKHAHISSEEIKQDIADTEAEIVTMEREITAYRLLGDRWSHMRAECWTWDRRVIQALNARVTGIQERQTFIAKLQAILDERKA